MFLLCALQTAVFAGDVSIPLRLGTGYFQYLAVKKIFTDPNQTFVAWNDGTGCNHLVLSDPVISSDPSGIRMRMNGEGRAGTPVGNLCVPLVPWQGEIDVIMAPSVAARGNGIELIVIDSQIRSSHGRADTGGAVWNWTKQYVHPRLATMRIDLSRPLMDLHSAARTLFPHSNAGPVDDILTSLLISDVSTDTEGMSLLLKMAIDAENQPPRYKQPVLSASEMARVDEVLVSWDVFVTLAAKQTALRTSDKALRDDLLAVLLNARHEIVRALETVIPGSEDPVRALFLDTWSELAPLIKKISSSIPDDTALDYIAFVGALDALRAIDAAGPGLNMDISTNGLRGLARLIAPPGQTDPLLYDEEVDPALRDLFDFGQPVELHGTRFSTGSGWLISSAWAQNSTDSDTLIDLDKWIPAKDNIHEYLVRVRQLLDGVGDKVLRDRELDRPYRDIFHPLLLASAWQETCWRQFIVEDGKQKPIKSSVGAVGIMQVSPRVWRGFYHPKPLTWNISYNATAGAEILHHYLVHYAIRKIEHKRSNDVQNLARATYSAYHGGPGHLTRYQKKNTSPELKRIDESFWRKYETIRAGNSLAVQQCYN